MIKIALSADVPEIGFDPLVVGEVIAHESAEHVHVAVGKIDQAKNPIDHRVSQRDECVRASLRDTVDELLQEGFQIQQN